MSCRILKGLQRDILLGQSYFSQLLEKRIQRQDVHAKDTRNGDSPVFVGKMA